MEQERLRAKEQKKDEEHESNIYRQWNDHENTVVSKLKYICAQPATAFVTYENTTLPPEFDGSLKPDFCMKFANRYIVFDAKKSKNIKSYIQDQVKLTAEKYKKLDTVSKTIFFVVPENNFTELSQTVFTSQGFTFITLSFSALEHPYTA